MSQRRDSAATRAALFRAAIELFAERGYDRTTVRDIAARAGVNQALLFRYFGSKEDLFAQAISADQRPDPACPKHFFHELLADVLDPDKPERDQQVIAAVMRTVGAAGPSTAISDRLQTDYADVLAGLSGEPDAELRAALLLSWLLGISLMRGPTGLPALTDAAPEDLHALIVPAARLLLDQLD